MSYSQETVVRKCMDIAKLFGFELDTPVYLNGRLTTTLGRVSYKSVNDVVVPTSIEFSKHFIENATDDEILDTIKHEMAHWLAATASGEAHGHDAYWKQWCIKIGAKPERCYKIEEMSKDAVKTREAKYKIYCQKCGQLIGTRTRACKLIKYPNLFTSSCCKAQIKITEI